VAGRQHLGLALRTQRVKTFTCPEVSPK